MPKFEVRLCAKFIVDAEDEDEAIEEALKSLEKELESPYVGLEDIFTAEVEPSRSRLG